MPRLQLPFARRLVPIAGVTVLAAVMIAVFTVDTRAQVLDQVVLDYRAIQFVWLDRLIPIAQRMFMLLAGIEMAVSAAIWGLRRPGSDDLIGEFVLKFAFLAFCFVLIFSFEFWVPPIIEGFISAGQHGSGMATLNPSEVFNIGNRLYYDIAAASAGTTLILNPIGVLTLWVAAMFVLLSFVSISFQLVRVLVEGFIVMSAGALFLGFSGSRFTASLAENYLLYAIRIGTKAFLTYLLVGLGTQLVAGWGPYLGQASFMNVDPVFQVLAGAMLFALLVLTIPGSFASGITNGARLGLANVVRGGIR